MRSCWMPKIVTPRVSSAPGPHSKHRNGRPFPYVIERACTAPIGVASPECLFSLYIPDCEARRQTGPKVRKTDRHPGSADDRSGRHTLPGGAVPMRLRTTSHPAHQLSYLRRCPVVRMLTRPIQIRAEALPGLRCARHDPARPPQLLPRVRIRAGPGRPAGSKPVLWRMAQTR